MADAPVFTDPAARPRRAGSPDAPTTAPAVVPAIDGLRGIAALLVLLFHCWVFTDAPLGGGALRALVAAGGLGVDFFFVISGFVLLLPAALRDGHFGDVRSYAVRRFARIAPAYYLSLVLQAFLVRPLTGFPPPFATAGGVLLFVAHLLFLQHELPASLVRATGYWGNVVGFGVNGVLWSLSIEALFYLTLPLVASRFCRSPVRGVLLAVAASLAWRALALAAPPLLTAGASGPVPRLLDQFPAFAAHFSFGMAAAVLYARAAVGAKRPPATSAHRPAVEPHSAGLRTVVAQLALVAALLAVMVAHGAQSGPPLGAARQLAELGPSLAFAIVLATAATTARGPLQVLARPRLRWLGDVSYGVFLWHLPLILAARRLLPMLAEKSDASFVVLCVLVVPASLLLGWLSRRFVEEPAIGWARSVTVRTGGARG